MMRMLQLFIFVVLSGFMFSYPSIFRASSDVSFFAFKFKVHNRSYRFDIRKKAANLWVQCMNMLDYFVNNDFRVCLFWSQGFILWVLGCYSVLLGAEISYTILGYLSLLFCGIALYLTYIKIKTI